MRSLDVYAVYPLGHAAAKHPGSEGLVTGSPAEIAELLLGFGELGFAEVRCDVYSKTLEGVEAMADVVDRVSHRVNTRNRCPSRLSRTPESTGPGCDGADGY